MTRNVVSASAVAALLWFGTPCVVSAQEPIVVELYGQGVHQFNRGEMSEAFQTLSTAIDQGSKDPRAYYYRGLALWNMGRPEQAELDFQEGAKLELSADRSYNVGKALERVQGPARLKLEDYRQKIRVQQFIARKEWERQRYESLKAAEEEVLRGAAKASASLPIEPKASDPTDPFGGGEAIDPGTPTEPEMTAPDTDNPFGAPMTDAPEAGENPLGAPMPLTDDPFAAPTKPAMESAPAAPATDDPFDAGAAPAPTPSSLDTPDAGPAMQPAPATPATDDPFGAPATPATDDPFATPAAAPATPAAMTPASDDPFAAPVTDAPEAGEDQLGAPLPLKDDPFAAPTKPAMESAPAAPATDDPFDAGAAPAPTPSSLATPDA
ncbi:hypothetical protein, partial [Blastopirellula marina]